MLILRTAQAHPFIALSYGAARDFKRMRNAYKKATGQTMTIYRWGGWRSLALTRKMRAAALAGHGDRYNILPGIIPSVPGTHHDGKCVDIFGGWDWAVKHAGYYNFFRTIPGDKNHFEHIPPKPKKKVAK